MQRMPDFLTLEYPEENLFQLGAVFLQSAVSTCVYSEILVKSGFEWELHLCTEGTLQMQAASFSFIHIHLDIKIAFWFSFGRRDSFINLVLDDWSN